MVSFFKKETVLCVASVLAVASCFFVRPSGEYLGYINWKTLGILLCMMVIVQLLKALGIFDMLVSKLVGRTSSVRGLVIVLVFACFFGSIVITNDISLLTFVPLAIAALKKVAREELAIPVVTLQTIAANTGSMINPFGSPHNIYVYTASGVSIGSFVKLLLPYWIVSFVVLFVVCLIIPSSSIDKSIGRAPVEIDRRDVLKKTFLGVDYFLLLTFVAFFILIGNLQRIPAVSSFFMSIVTGRELLCSVLACQIISNVPGGMMLCGFSKNFNDIIIGVNIGGLGTLIASMANLISYKILAKEYNEKKGKYLFVFTFSNVVLLGFLIGVYFIV